MLGCDVRGAKKGGRIGGEMGPVRPRIVASGPIGRDRRDWHCEPLSEGLGCRGQGGRLMHAEASTDRRHENDGSPERLCGWSLRRCSMCRCSMFSGVSS